jgi:hypothetical protein
MDKTMKKIDWDALDKEYASLHEAVPQPRYFKKYKVRPKIKQENRIKPRKSSK